MKKKIKVLQLLQSNSYSGAENVVFQIINMFKDCEYDMIYCSQDGRIREKLEHAGIECLLINKFNYLEIRKAINLINPDIIHAHDAHASVLASMFSVPVISHMHGNHDNLKKISLKSILYLLTSIKYKHVFWVSKSALKEYKFSRFINSRSSVLYNNIQITDLKKRIELDNIEYNFDIIFLGRLNEIKDPIRMLDIVKSICAKHETLKIAIVGDGELNEECKKFVINNHLENHVTFFGYMDNPLKVLLQSKVMIMTSKYEGTPMSALEALSIGTPIVATPVDGLKDIITNGYNGYLSSDNKHLEEHIIRIIHEGKHRYHLSNNAKKSMTNFNNIASYREKIYRQYDSIQVKKDDDN